MLPSKTYHPNNVAQNIHCVAASLLRILVELQPSEEVNNLTLRLNGLMWREINGADPVLLEHECLDLAKWVFIVSKIYPTV